MEYTSSAALLPTRAERYEALRSRIGNTPAELVPELAGTVWSKLEFANPSGSHYDRAYLATLETLETDGLIRPGDELRDITSGSAGTSLAWLARELGYAARITVPAELPANRLRDMRAYGAELISSGHGYIHGASRFQREEMLAFAKNSAWRRLRPGDKTMRAVLFENAAGQRVAYLNHSENDITPRSFAAIAHELVSQIVVPPESVALAIGNCTTILGIAPVLRRHWSATRLVGYQSEPGETYENFGVVSQDTAGTDVAVRFRDEALGLLDEVTTVGNEARDAMAARINLARPTDRQLGRSSLMGLVVIERSNSASAVTIAYDRADRY